MNYTDMLAKGGSIYKDNPGLFEEIEAHEEGHIEQIMVAAGIPIEYQMKIGNKQVKFKGPIDQVLKDVRTQLSDSKKGRQMGLEGVDKYTADKVFPELSDRVLTNTDLISTLPHDVVENDANERASKKLPALEYSRPVNPKPIIVNGVELKE